VSHGATRVIWVRTLLFVAAVLTAAIFLHRHIASEVAVGLLAVALLAMGVYHAWFLSRISQWANLPSKRVLPIGWGMWMPLIERLNRFSRNQQDRVTELESELERIHAAVDRLPDGLVVLDRFDHIAWSNQAAEALHGIFGTRRPIDHFIRHTEFNEMLPKRDLAVQKARIDLPTRPGRVFEMQLHQADEGFRLLITRDITEQAKLDAMRSDFVANVSHEIRTPATVISGFAETLLTLELDESARREYLGAILRQSETMGRLVGDLLLISSLERSPDRADEMPIALRGMLAALMDEARALSSGRHTLSLYFDGPSQVLAVPAELESAIRNLLTNAVRYTPERGSIEVDWRVRDDEGWLSIRDTGIGIAAEHLPRLTERFYRVDRSRSRDTGGTGLGLAIVKRIANRHQAQLRIESEAGRGSTFTLCLPARRLLPEPVSSAHEAVQAA
jgi:two-component system phosphate regulon sensor histidine kinase PhoR